MDMLLLTLPEKIMQCCHEKESIVPPNEFHFTAKYRGCYDASHLPTIGTFIPLDLQPSTILANDDMVTNYSTPQLLAIGNKKPAGKNKNQKRLLNLRTLHHQITMSPTFNPTKILHLPIHTILTLENFCKHYATFIKELKPIPTVL
jgi:hypothetical protein